MDLHRPVYSSDLNDSEWQHLEPLVPLTKPGGRPPKHSRREILNGIFYVTRSGCAWHLLPHDLPAWRTVYPYFCMAGKTASSQMRLRTLTRDYRSIDSRRYDPADGTST